MKIVVIINVKMYHNVPVLSDVQCIGVSFVGQVCII